MYSPMPQSKFSPHYHTHLVAPPAPSPNIRSRHCSISPHHPRRSQRLQSQSRSPRPTSVDTASPKQHNSSTYFLRRRSPKSPKK